MYAYYLCLYIRRVRRLARNRDTHDCKRRRLYSSSWMEKNIPNGHRLWEIHNCRRICAMPLLTFGRSRKMSGIDMHLVASCHRFLARQTCHERVRDVIFTHKVVWSIVLVRPTLWRGGNT